MYPTQKGSACIEFLNLFIIVLGETLEEVLKWGITLQTVKMTQEAVVKRNTGKSPLPAVLQAAEHSAGKNLVEGQDRIRVLVAPIPAPKIEGKCREICNCNVPV